MIPNSMTHYSLLKKKRRHVISYKKDVPAKEIIDRALENPNLSDKCIEEITNNSIKFLKDF